MRSTLIAATSAMVLLVLDASVVGVMLPSMRVDLALGPGEQAWVVAIYLLTLAVALPFGGRLCDAIGAARAFALGMVGFVVASLGIGLAFSGAALLAWRGVAGVAAALLMPAGLAVIADVFPAGRRGAALAAYTGVGQSVAALAPLIGGLCAQYLGWRWGFLLNVPVGLVGLALLVRARPVTPRHPGRVLIDLGLFRRRRFAGAAFALFALGAAVTVATIYGASALQEALGLPPAGAGVALLPMVVPLLAATRWAARHGERAGFRRLGVRGSLVLAAGLLVAAGGFVAGSLVVVCAGLVPIGVGIGLLLSPMINAALSAVPADRRGQASGLASMLRQLGGVGGVGALGAVIAAFPVTPDGGPPAAPVAIGFAGCAALMVAAAAVVARSFPRSADPGEGIADEHVDDPRGEPRHP